MTCTLRQGFRSSLPRRHAGWVRSRGNCSTNRLRPRCVRGPALSTRPRRMGETTTDLSAAVREQLATLFRDRAPVLVEVRFPRMGTSSDWYLFETIEELDQLRRRLAAGVELYAASTWDIDMGRGAVKVVL